MEESNSTRAFDYEFLSKLIVGIGEVSRITGIPTRQIRYWEDKNIITSLTDKEGENRRYDYKNIKRMLLIKELLDEGYTLQAAAQRMEKRCELLDTTFAKFKSESEKD